MLARHKLSLVSGVAAGIAFVVVFLVLSPSAPGDPSSFFHHPRVRDTLQPFGVEPSVLPGSAVRLGWHAIDADCEQVYRIDSRYEPGLEHEENTTSGLALRRHPKRKPYRALPGRPSEVEGDPIELEEGAPLPEGAIVPGELFYLGLRAERVGATRDFYASGRFLGPASPMAGCYWRTWDPMEDAFALGWPELPDRLTAVGETWSGMRVEAQCARAGCVDDNGGGGPQAHHLPCATGPFVEKLVGIYELGGEPFALIHSTWSDGHEGTGISSERLALVSVQHGRPAWARVTVDHKFMQPTVNRKMEPIVRTWEMTAIDQCPGSLASVGWSRPDEDTERATRLVEQLQSAENLRRHSNKKGRRADPFGE